MENCSGCSIIRSKIPTCYIKVCGREKRCPCKECLVKVICNVICYKYVNLYFDCSLKETDSYGDKRSM